MDVIALPLGGLLEQGGLDLITYPHLPPAARMELGTELQVIGFPVGFSSVGEDVPSPLTYMIEIALTAEFLIAGRL